MISVLKSETGYTGYECKTAAALPPQLPLTALLQPMQLLQILHVFRVSLLQIAGYGIRISGIGYRYHLPYFAGLLQNHYPACQTLMHSLFMILNYRKVPFCNLAYIDMGYYYGSPAFFEHPPHLTQ